jgi:hypothetical protein
MHEKLVEDGSLYEDEKDERLKSNPTYPGSGPGNAEEEDTVGQQ